MIISLILTWNRILQLRENYSHGSMRRDGSNIVIGVLPEDLSPIQWFCSRGLSVKLNTRLCTVLDFRIYRWQQSRVSFLDKAVTVTNTVRWVSAGRIKSVEM